MTETIMFTGDIHDLFLAIQEPEDVEEAKRFLDEGNSQPRLQP